MKRKLILAGIIGLFTLGVIALEYFVLNSEKADRYPENRIATGPRNIEAVDADKMTGAGQGDRSPELKAQLSAESKSADISAGLQQVFNETPMSVEKLQNDYRDKIDIPDARRDLIQDYLYYLREKYPENADALFAELLALAFPPDIAAQVLAMAQHLDAYREWYAANRSSLLDLSREERKELLWNKRVEFFGEAAYELWSGELKRDEVFNTLQSINEAEEATVAEKYSMLDNALKRAYGPDAEAYMEHHREELWDEFVSVESVQEDLHEMDEKDRRQAMRKIRQRLGMDEEAIERLGELDKTRDDRWESGQAYMAARREIVESYQGEEQERMLNLLRRDYFGEEAAIVKNEEKAGFFRFERKRQYGKF